MITSDTPKERHSLIKQLALNCWANDLSISETRKRIEENIQHNIALLDLYHQICVWFKEQNDEFYDWCRETASPTALTTYPGW